MAITAREAHSFDSKEPFSRADARAAGIGLKRLLVQSISEDLLRLLYLLKRAAHHEDQSECGTRDLPNRQFPESAPRLPEYWGIRDDPATDYGCG
jgi:hypothetical protein